MEDESDYSISSNSNVQPNPQFSLPPVPDVSFFDLFFRKLIDKFQGKPINKYDVLESFDLTSKQIDEWLKIGVEKDLLVKKNRPVRYIIKKENNRKLDLFTNID